MADKIAKEYEGEWRVSIPIYSTEFRNIVTPSFKPLDDSNITFCFEAWYQKINYKDADLTLFKLKLVKLSNACTSSTLEVIVDVKVNYYDGSLFKNYQALPSTNVDAINEITFEDIIRAYYENDCYTAHHTKMGSNTLIIKCTMSFYNHIQTQRDIEKKTNKLFNFIRNFESMYEPSTLSDFTFKVGDKSFSAHKFVLAAHSPVFKKMMTHEFLESKTNNVIITDATPEIFDSFLRSLYSGELSADKSWNSLKEIYRLADKYDVEFLKNECTDAAISLLSVDLVCEILQLAYSYSDADLKTAAVNYAVNHIKEIVPREDWNELVKSNSLIGYEVTVNFIPK